MNIKRILRESIVSIVIISIFGASYATLSTLTATDSETLTSAKWNALVEHAVPTGFVGSFNLSSCPDGWIEYTAANGKTIVGLNVAETEFDTLGETGGEKNHTLTVSEMASHNHTTNSVGAHTHNSTTRYSNLQGGVTSAYQSAGPSYGSSSTAATKSAGNHTHTISSAGSNTAHNNLQPYVALLYCVKD